MMNIRSIQWKEGILLFL